MSGAAEGGLAPWRITLLRGMYVIVALGLAIQIWPLMLQPAADVELMRGVVRSFLVTVSLLALVGVRYPLQMLPLLMFELVWKTVWVLKFGMPEWSAGTMDAPTAETMKACLMGAVLIVVIPWDYVLAGFARKPADPWRGAA